MNLRARLAALGTGALFALAAALGIEVARQRAFSIRHWISGTFDTVSVFYLLLGYIVWAGMLKIKARRRGTLVLFGTLAGVVVGLLMPTFFVSISYLIDQRKYAPPLIGKLADVLVSRQVVFTTLGCALGGALAALRLRLNTYGDRRPMTGSEAGVSVGVAAREARDCQTDGDDPKMMTAGAI